MMAIGSVCCWANGMKPQLQNTPVHLTDFIVANQSRHLTARPFLVFSLGITLLEIL